MLALPFLIGIAATRFDLWDLPLGAAAVAGYLASATALTWARARSRERYSVSLVAYALVAAIFGAALVVTHPGLALVLVILVPAGVATLVAAKSGRARGLVAGLAQVAETLVLVPASAYLAGPLDWAIVGRATFLAAIYLVGALLAVRSLIREQGNSLFAAVSIGFHVAAAAVGVVLLPWPYVVLLALLAVRSVALPVVQGRRRGSARPLRPIHVGVLEMVAAVCVVGIAFAVPI